MTELLDSTASVALLRDKSGKASINVPNQRRLTVTVPAAGAILGLSRNAAYEAAKRNELPVIRFGSRLYVPLPALARLLQIDEAELAQRIEECAGTEDDAA
jgi:hypothetical protein